MSLRNILLDVSSVLGLDISDSEEMLYTVTKVNEAAEELYASEDLPGCLREQLFKFIDAETFQISLPYYVSKPRAARYYNTQGGQISLLDMRPRYHRSAWGSENLLHFRVKSTDAILKREPSADGPITFTIKTAQSVDIIITIVGKTREAEKVEEQVTITAGQLTTTSTKTFVEFANIEKTDYYDVDVAVTDINDEELAVIPNCLLRPFYTIVQFRHRDFDNVNVNSFPLDTFELLYKQRFVPLRNLRDEFPCPGCDKLIFWSFVAHYSAYKPGLENKFAAASLKVQDLRKQLLLDDDLGKVLKLNWGPSQFSEAQKPSKYPFTNLDGIYVDNPYYKPLT